MGTGPLFDGEYCCGDRTGLVHRYSDRYCTRFETQTVVVDRCSLRADCGCDYILRSVGDHGWPVASAVAVWRVFWDAGRAYCGRFSVGAYDTTDVGLGEARDADGIRLHGSFYREMCTFGETYTHCKAEKAEKRRKIAKFVSKFLKKHLKFSPIQSRMYFVKLFL